MRLEIRYGRTSLSRNQNDNTSRYTPPSPRWSCGVYAWRNFLLDCWGFFHALVYQALARFDAQPYSSVAITVLVFVIFGRIFRRFWLGFKTGSCAIELNTYGINFSRDGEDTFIAFADEDAGFTHIFMVKRSSIRHTAFGFPTDIRSSDNWSKITLRPFHSNVPSPVFITF